MYTAYWSEKDTRIFTKAFNKAKAGSNATTKNPQMKVIAKELQKFPKLLSKFYAIRSDVALGNTLRIRVALGEIKLTFCEVCTEPTVPGKMYCSTKCSANSDKTQKRRIKTNRERYGTDHGTQSECVKRKMADTFSNRSSEQRVRTRKKRIRTCNKRYGGNAPASSKNVRSKMETTCMSNLGVRFPMQNKNVLLKAHKSSYQTKDYVLGSRVVAIQGYEDKALDYVLRRGIPAKNIYVHDRVPSFHYLSSTGLKSTYHPDFLVRHSGKSIIVEVKSPYTLTCSPRTYSTNILKAESVLAKGFLFKLLVMDSNGELCQNLPSNWMEFSRKQLKQVMGWR